MRMDEYTCKGEQSKIFTMLIGKTDSEFFLSQLQTGNCEIGGHK